MSRVKGKVHLGNWGLETVHNAKAMFERVVKTAAAEAIDIALRDEDTYAYMPFVDSVRLKGAKRRRAAALAIHFHLGLGTGANRGERDPVYKTNLRELLDFEIEACAQDGSWAEELTVLRDALRELADDIDKAVQAAPK